LSNRVLLSPKSLTDRWSLAQETVARTNPHRGLFLDL
jgi:hypothetical protein